MSTIINELDDLSSITHPYSVSGINLQHKQNDQHFSLASEHFSSIMIPDENEEKYKNLELYTNRLLMKMEDFRSSHLRFEKTDWLSISMTEYFNRYINNYEDDVKVNETIARDEFYKNNKESTGYKSSIESVTKINDYFFSQSDLIEDMEYQYKANCDPFFECKKYSNYVQKKNILDLEIEKIIIEKEKLQTEIEKYIKKKKKLKDKIINYNKIMKDAQNFLCEKKNEYQKMKEIKEKYLETTRVYEIFIQEHEMLKKLLMAQSEEELLWKADVSPRSNWQAHKGEDHEIFKHIISKIEHELNLHVDPANIAINIIEEIKNIVKASENEHHISKVEGAILTEELKSRHDIINSYLKAEKKKLLEERQKLEHDQRWINSFKMIENYNNGADKIRKSVEIIFKEKKKIDHESDLISKTLTSLNCIEKTIIRSVNVYKEAYKDIYRIYKFLDLKINELKVLIERTPGLAENPQLKL